MLLKFKADVDITNHRGETPLHLACHNIQSIEVRESSDQTKLCSLSLPLCFPPKFKRFYAQYVCAFNDVINISTVCVHLSFTLCSYAGPLNKTLS